MQSQRAGRYHTHYSMQLTRHTCSLLTFRDVRSVRIFFVQPIFSYVALHPSASYAEVPLRAQVLLQPVAAANCQGNVANEVSDPGITLLLTANHTDSIDKDNVSFKSLGRNKNR